MGERPRTVKAMLAEAKDRSELMLDLAYATLLSGEHDIGEEVLELEEELSDLVHDMRETCLRASRSPSDAAGLASLLQIIASIEVLGNQAVDIAKIVLRRVGIPREIRRALREAEEIVDRLAVREGSALEGRDVAATELAAHGVRLLAVRRAGEWIFDPPEGEVLCAEDTLVVRGIEEALDAVRELAGMEPLGMAEEEAALSDLERAVDTLVEMKDVSELAVALAYATVLTANRPLATEVNRLEDRLDRMREEVETWSLTAAQTDRARSSLRGLIHLAVAAETVGDAAQEMVRLIEAGEELHPIVGEALGEAEDVVYGADVGPASEADGRTLAELELQQRTGTTVIAVLRDDRWRHRPGPRLRLQAGDSLLLTGPSETRDEVHAIVGASAATTAPR